jgi:hypothetical protein
MVTELYPRSYSNVVPLLSLTEFGIVSVEGPTPDIVATLSVKSSIGRSMMESSAQAELTSPSIHSTVVS